MKYCNYVVYMPRLRQIKIGRTSNAERRFNEIGRMASRFGETEMSCMTSQALKGIATITETELRRKYRALACNGGYEWFSGDESSFAMFCEETKLIQQQLAAALGGMCA